MSYYLPDGEINCEYILQKVNKLAESIPNKEDVIVFPVEGIDQKDVIKIANYLRQHNYKVNRKSFLSGYMQIRRVDEGS